MKKLELEIKPEPEAAVAEFWKFMLGTPEMEDFLREDMLWLWWACSFKLAGLAGLPPAPKAMEELTFDNPRCCWYT